MEWCRVSMTAWSHTVTLHGSAHMSACELRDVGAGSVGGTQAPVLPSGRKSLGRGRRPRSVPGSGLGRAVVPVLAGSGGTGLRGPSETGSTDPSGQVNNPPTRNPLEGTDAGLLPGDASALCSSPGPTPS